jgi:hypothetical protein
MGSGAENYCQKPSLIGVERHDDAMPIELLSETRLSIFTSRKPSLRGGRDNHDVLTLHDANRHSAVAARGNDRCECMRMMRWDENLEEIKQTS